MDALEPPLDRLIAAMQKAGMPLRAAASLDELCSAPDATYIAQPKLRLAQHFDFDPDLLILDRGLHTLGIVRVFTGDQQSDGGTMKFIDQAVYVRHLLLTEIVRDTPMDPSESFTVEAVMLSPAGAGREGLDNALRAVARETEFLHAVGINLLRYGGAQEFSEADLRRAFPWLLSWTRRWFASLESQDSRPVVEEITLRNYRLPGERKWKLEPGRLHLLFGQNGTGKSSIAEALEMAVTGHAERLGEPGDILAGYDGIVRNADSSSPAEVLLTIGAESRRCPVTERGVENPLAADVPVTAFRLDQLVMDRLTRQSAAERAELFLRSFFPEDRAAYDGLTKAQETFGTAYAKLPADIRSSVTNQPAEVERRFAWLAEKRPPGAEGGADCLPLPVETLRQLAPLAPEIRDAVKGWPAGVSAPDYANRLNLLDKGLDRIRQRASPYREEVRTARQILDQVQGWTTSATASGDGWITSLNEWLENVAMADLAEKQRQVLGSLQAAVTAGWTSTFAAIVPLLGVQIVQFEQLRDAAIKRRDEIFTRLIAPANVLQAAAGTPLRLPEFSERNVAALDTVGPWLAKPSSASEPFGKVLHRAISANTTMPFGEITIGVPGWAAGPIAALGSMEAGLSALCDLELNAAAQATGKDLPVYVGPATRLESFQAALAGAKEVAAKQQLVEQTFLIKLADGRLNGALNELMALFTPARWAYRDLTLVHQMKAGRHAVRLKLDAPHLGEDAGVAAELWLNTAELNIFTVALYLLCAVRVKNPLGMIVFDDPLQNMDELTVSAVARGIAKVMCLEGTWKLALMFHGENDLERFRHDLPCAVYRLPWLTPAGSGAQPVSIEGEAATGVSPPAPKELKALIALRED